MANRMVQQQRAIPSEIRSHSSARAVHSERLGGGWGDVVQQLPGPRCRAKNTGMSNAAPDTSLLFVGSLDRGHHFGLSFYCLRHLSGGRVMRARMLAACVSVAMLTGCIRLPMLPIGLSILLTTADTTIWFITGKSISEHAIDEFMDGFQEEILLEPKGAGVHGKVMLVSVSAQGD